MAHEFDLLRTKSPKAEFDSTAVSHPFDLLRSKPEPTVSDNLGDIGRLALQGTAGIGGAVGLGLQQTGIAPELGKTLRESSASEQQRLGAKLTPEMQSAQAEPLINSEYQQDTEQGSSFVNPKFGMRSLAANVVPSIPGSLAMAVPGGIAAKGIELGAKALGAGKTIAPILGRSLGFGGSEGVFSGLSNADQWGTEQRAKPIETFMQHPAWNQALANNGNNPEAAKESLIQQGESDIVKDTSLKTGAISGLTGGGAAGMLMRNVEKPVKGIIGPTLKSMGVEAAQEAPQSFYENKTTNQATQSYIDPNQDINAGNLNAGILGGVAGGVMGAIGIAGPLSNALRKAAPPASNQTILGATNATNTSPTPDVITESQQVNRPVDATTTQFNNQPDLQKQDQLNANTIERDGGNINDVGSESQVSGKITAQNVSNRRLGSAGDNTKQYEEQPREKEIGQSATEQLRGDLNVQNESLSTSANGSELSNSQVGNGAETNAEPAIDTSADSEPGSKTISDGSVSDEGRGSDATNNQLTQPKKETKTLSTNVQSDEEGRWLLGEFKPTHTLDNENDLPVMSTQDEHTYVDQAGNEYYEPDYATPVTNEPTQTTEQTRTPQQETQREDTPSTNISEPGVPEAVQAEPVATVSNVVGGLTNEQTKTTNIDTTTPQEGTGTPTADVFTGQGTGAKKVDEKTLKIGDRVKNNILTGKYAATARTGTVVNIVKDKNNIDHASVDWDGGGSLLAPLTQFNKVDVINEAGDIAAQSDNAQEVLTVPQIPEQFAQDKKLKNLKTKLQSFADKKQADKHAIATKAFNKHLDKLNNEQTPPTSEKENKIETAGKEAGTKKPIAENYKTPREYHAAVLAWKQQINTAPIEKSEDQIKLDELNRKVALAKKANDRILNKPQGAVPMSIGQDAFRNANNRYLKLVEERDAHVAKMQGTTPTTTLDEEPVEPPFPFTKPNNEASNWIKKNVSKDQIETLQTRFNENKEFQRDADKFNRYARTATGHIEGSKAIDFYSAFAPDINVASKQEEPTGKDSLPVKKTALKEIDNRIIGNINGLPFTSKKLAQAALDNSSLTGSYDVIEYATDYDTGKVKSWAIKNNNPKNYEELSKVATTPYENGSTAFKNGDNRIPPGYKTLPKFESKSPKFLKAKEWLKGYDDAANAQPIKQPSTNLTNDTNADVEKEGVESTNDQVTYIGINIDNEKIYEKPDGSRYIDHGNLIENESISIVPTQQGVKIARNERKSSFKTTDEYVKDNVDTANANLPYSFEIKDNGESLGLYHNGKAEIQNLSRINGVSEAIRHAHLINERNIKKEKSDRDNIIKAAKDSGTEPTPEMAKLDADIDDLLGEIGQGILSRLSMKAVPEEEVDLLPLISKLMGLLVKKGYLTFEANAHQVIALIRDKFGDKVADNVHLDELKGGYIGMRKGTTSQKDVVSYDSIEQLEKYYANDTRTKTNASDTTSETINQPGVPTKQPGSTKQEGDKADVKPEEAPNRYDAAIELEQDPIKKRKLEIERDIAQASSKTNNLEKQISTLAKRIRVANENKESYVKANVGIDNRETPKYEDQTDKERKLSIASFKKRQAEQRAKNVVRIADIEKDLVELNADKAIRESELADHKQHIADIRDKYVVNGVVSVDAIRISNAFQFSKADTVKSGNTYTPTSLKTAMQQVMDGEYGDGWFGWLLETGKFKIIDSSIAKQMAGVGSLFHAAWHGSPHDHMGFDSSKIGTGEGAQAFGYGHYFTDAKSIAEWYKNELSQKQVSKYTVDGITRDKSNVLQLEGALLLNGISSRYAQEALSYLDGSLDISSAKSSVIFDKNKFGDDEKYNYDEVLKALYLISEDKNTGKLYNVELAPEQDEYLDWDKPLSEQSDLIKEKINNLPENIIEHLKDRYRGYAEGYSFEEFINSKNISGKSLYNYLADDFDIGSDKAASDMLHSLGIRGIRYKAEAGKSEANNYVVFDDADIKIVAKYSRDGKTIQAFYNPANDTTYFVADNIDKGVDLFKLAQHEIGVHALTLGETDAEFQKIMEDMLKLVQTSKPLQTAYTKALESFGIGEVPRDGRPVNGVKREDVLHELAGYLVEKYPRLSHVQRLVSWMRKAIRNLGKALPSLERMKWVKWSNSLNEKDVVYMAISALRNAPTDLLQSNIGRKGDAVLMAKESAPTYSDTDKQALESLFKNLSPRANPATRAAALSRINDFKDSDKIKYIEENFYDILGTLEESGKVVIKC